MRDWVAICKEQQEQISRLREQLAVTRQARDVWFYSFVLVMIVMHVALFVEAGR